MKNRCILHGRVFVMLHQKFKNRLHGVFVIEQTSLSHTWSQTQKDMSRVMRKPDFCICENKDADQLRGNREADQRLCLHYTDSSIPQLPKSEI